jgi:hypothetical protein
MFQFACERRGGVEWNPVKCDKYPWESDFFFISGFKSYQKFKIYFGDCQ